jgi:hypothetical protein
MKETAITAHASSPRSGWVAALLLALGAATLALAGQAPEGKTVSTVLRRYSFDRPQRGTNGHNVRIVMPGCGQLNRRGEPALPFRTARLLIPPGSKVTKVEATPVGDPVKLEGTWHVEYAGQPLSRPGRGQGEYLGGINRLIYNTDDLYPREAAELVSVQRLAGCDIALVRLYPMRYKPASGELRFASQLDVQLTLTPALTNAEPPLHPPGPGRVKSRVASFVDNPDLLAAYEWESPAAARPAQENFDYLLITSSNLVTAFQPLVERKIKDGLAVNVATVEDISYTVSGADAPEKIRNYIRQAYTNWGISYVLLGGGTTVVPCRYAYVRADLPPKDSYIPCDLYYACLDGSWNSDGDRHWGGPHDGEQGGDVDLLAEVYVGRAPVSSAEQVKTFVEKSVRYETHGPLNPTNALLMATFLGDFPTGPCQGAAMYEPLLPLLSSYDVRWLDDRPKKVPQWMQREALEALNQSPHVVFYNGHGSEEILMRLHTFELARLTNQWPFLLFSVGCGAAEFDHGKFFPDSFGETLINGSSQGAFAAILNSRVGWFDPQYPWKYSGEFQAKFLDELVRGRSRNLGGACQRAKEDLIGSVEGEGPMTYRWCYYEITLLGDPHLPFQLPDHNEQLAVGAQSNPLAGGPPSSTVRPLNH